MNELLIVFSIILFFGLTILWQKLFGKDGLLVWIAIATIAANIEVMIIVNAFGAEQTLGNILFAATFLATDILSENYGKKAARKAVFVGIFTSVCFIVISQLWRLYSPAESDFAFPHIDALFSSTPRIMISGLAVYAITQYFDVWLYHKWWSYTEKRYGDKKKMLWLRNNGSTLISQLLNTVLFNVAAFAGVFDFKTLLSIIIAGYALFIVTSLADTPFVYLSRKIAAGEKRDDNGEERDG